MGGKDYLCGGLTYIDFVAYDLAQVFNLMFEGRLFKALPKN